MKWANFLNQSTITQMESYLWAVRGRPMMKSNMNRNEVGKLPESINNHLDGIILVGSGRQTHDEIHADVFPFLGRNIQ
jgi:hypothetical protein